MRLFRDHLQGILRSSSFLPLEHPEACLAFHLRKSISSAAACGVKAKGASGVFSGEPQPGFLRSSFRGREITNSSPESAPEDKLSDRHDSLVFSGSLLTSRGRVWRYKEMLRLEREHPERPPSLPRNIRSYPLPKASMASLLISSSRSLYRGEKWKSVICLTLAILASVPASLAVR